MSPTAPAEGPSSATSSLAVLPHRPAPPPACAPPAGSPPACSPPACAPPAGSPPARSPTGQLPTGTPARVVSTEQASAFSSAPPAPPSQASCGPPRCTGPPAAPTCSAPSTRRPWPTPGTPPPGGWPPSCPTTSRSSRFGLDGSFAAYLGRLIPWGAPVTLLGETPEQVATAQRELVGIGIDRPAAAATGTPGDWSGGAPLATVRRAGFGDLATARAGEHTSDVTIVVLDVRRTPEWDTGHLAGAVHVPLHDLLRRTDEIPPGQPQGPHDRRA
jgi:hypothetical protein